VAAHKSALIWFAISSAEVFEALKCGRYESLKEHLDMDIEPQAFWDLSNLLNDKAHFELGIRVVRDLWSLRCSPPPCRFGISGYNELLAEIERHLSLPESK
jgi:hypothetical protein